MIYNITTETKAQCKLTGIADTIKALKNLTFRINTKKTKVEKSTQYYFSWNIVLTTVAYTGKVETWQHQTTANLSAIITIIAVAPINSKITIESTNKPTTTKLNEIIQDKTGNPQTTKTKYWQFWNNISTNLKKKNIITEIKLISDNSPKPVDLRGNLDNIQEAVTTSIVLYRSGYNNTTLTWYSTAIHLATRRFIWDTQNTKQIAA